MRTLILTRKYIIGIRLVDDIEDKNWKKQLKKVSKKKGFNRMFKNLFIKCWYSVLLKYGHISLSILKQKSYTL